MKKILSLLFFSLVSLSIYAQSSTGNDTNISGQDVAWDSEMNDENGTSVSGDDVSWDTDSIGEMTLYSLCFIVDGVVYKILNIPSGATIIAEPAPTKEGYTFSGWQNVPEMMPAHNDTITGFFTVNKYLVTYKVDGEVYYTDSIEYGSIIAIIDAPTREGYTFGGWTGVPSLMPAYDVTVTGTFSVDRYVLTYIVDDEFYKSQNVCYGSVITLPDPPVKEGYTFSGWQNVPEMMPAHNDTITGFFTVNKYLITYKVDGDVYYTDSIEYGTSITPIDNPEEEGYEFQGWSGFPDDMIMPAHNLTISGIMILSYVDSVIMIDLTDEMIFNAKGQNIGNVFETPTLGIFIINGRKFILAQ